MTMRTFTMKRSFSAAFVLAAVLTVPSNTAAAFSPMNPVPRAAATLSSSSSSSSSALYFKPSSSSPPDTSSTSSSSGAASPTKTAAASIGEFSAVSTSASEAVASRIANTLQRKTRRTTTTSSSTSSSLQQLQQQKSVSTSNTELPIYQLALAGSVTTALADFVMHPIDCIKTIQQSDLGMDWSIVQTASYIQETFGLSGFFYGFCTYAMADAVGGAIKFSVWELWKKHATRVSLPFATTPSSSESTSMDLTWLGPAMAFVASSIVIVPGEFLKQQLQMAHYDNVWHALMSVYSTSGLAGFFAGYDGVLLRDIPYTMLELGMYEVFKNFIQSQKSNDIGSDKKNDSVMDQVLAAALTGAIVAMFTTPMDVIKTKLMVDSYVNYADCLMTTIQHHGLASLYSGGLARLAWVVPFTAIYLPTYDFLKQQLLQRHVASLQEQHEAAAARTTFATSVTTSPLETI